MPATQHNTAVAVAALGCIAAGLVRNASLCWFIKEACDQGELNSWRCQRANLALAAGAGVALAIHLGAWGSVHPLPQLLAAAGSASVVALAARHLVLALVAGMSFGLPLGRSAGGVLPSLSNLATLLIRDMSTVGGAIIAATLVVCGHSAVQLLGAGAAQASAAAAAVAVGAPAAAPGLVYLRSVGGAALLPLVGMCWLLLEFCAGMYRPTQVHVMQTVILGALQEERQRTHPLASTSTHGRATGAVPPLCAPADRFSVLQAGLGASLVMQGAFLWCGAAAGAFPGTPDAFWGAMHWTCLMGAAYFGVVVAVVDWLRVGEWLWGLGSFFGSLISLATRSLFLNPEWWVPNDRM